MPRVQVHSETGRLRCVLMHTPGREHQLVPPNKRKDFLVDDILYLPAAIESTKVIQEVIRRSGATVLQFRDLLLDILNDEASRGRCLRQLCSLHTTGISELIDVDANALVRYLIEGDGIDGVPDLDPLPNIAFQRDIGMAVGNAVLVGCMKEPVRDRESGLFQAIVNNHPVFADAVKLNNNNYIEGGDVCVVNSEVAIIGYGHRTERIAAEEVSEELFKQNFKTVVIIEQPNGREHMHLDTVFTIVSESECLLYAPFIFGSKRHKLEIPPISLHQPGKATKYIEGRNLLDCLSDIGVHLKPIICGGGDGDHVQADQEQWWDGVNAFAVAPGRVLLYDRDEATLAEFKKSGYTVRRIRNLEEASLIPEDEERVVYAVPSSEICHARGGPRCLSMPLSRE